MGPRQFTFVLRRRNACHARHLWSRPALHRNGRPCPKAMGEVRAQVETAVSPSQRSVMDGCRPRRLLRARLRRAAAQGTDKVSGTFRRPIEEALAADQL